MKFLRKKKGIWENIPPGLLPGFLPFEQAKLFIHQLKFESSTQWNDWKKEGKRPAFIPSNPQVTYLNKVWLDWQDWIGTGFLPFTKARTFVRRQSLKSRKEYLLWLNSGKRPKRISCNPEQIYKHTGWIDLNDWLGIAKNNRLTNHQDAL